MAGRSRSSASGSPIPAGSDHPAAPVPAPVERWDGPDGRQRLVRSVKRHRQGFLATLEEVERQLDVARAWRSFPPPTEATDLQGVPRAFDLWVDHVIYQRTGDSESRDRLFEEYRPLAGSLAKQMQRGGEPFDDLVQVSFEALVRAIDRFDPDRRLPFVAFAKPTIVGSLKRHFRDYGWGMRVPREAQELAAPISAATDALHQELGRPPKRAEVAEALEVPEADVGRAQAALAARETASLDAGVVGGAAPRPDPAMVLAENRVALGQALEHLGVRDREVLALYFGGELSQNEIAARYDVSQMQVSRWIRSALQRLGEELSA